MRGEGLKVFQKIGARYTADSVIATGIFDVSVFDHAGFGTNEFSQIFINRYNLSGNDEVKRVGKSALTQATGFLAHDSVTAYSNTTDLAYELLGVPPDVLNDGIARAQKKRYTSVMRLLPRARDSAGNVADMDMQASGVLMWGTTAGTATNATPTKSTDADDVTNDVQSLKVSLSAASGFVRSASFRVNAGQSIYTAMLARADVGTLTFRMYDVTHGTYFGSDLTYSGKQFAMLERPDTAPSGCYEVAVEIRGTGATDVLIVQGITGPWAFGTKRIELPQWLNEQYKLRFLKPALFYSIGSNVYDAESRTFTGDYAGPDDFFVETFHRDVAAYHLQIVNDDLADALMTQPVYISAERSRALDEPLTSESATTTEDNLEDLLNYVLAEWASDLAIWLPNDSEWSQLKNEYERKTAITVLTHPPPPKTEVPRRYVVRA